MENNTPVVWHYICYPEQAASSLNDYCILKVRPADEAAFMQSHGHRIICKGASLMAALLAFEAMKR